MSHSTVVVIGASFAGLHLAHSLLKDLTNNVKVVLINPSQTFYFVVAAPRVVAKPNAFRPEQYLIPIQKEFDHYPSDNFEFVLGRATSIDSKHKTVTVNKTQAISYDYLVIASGGTTASTNPDSGIAIPFKQPNSDNVQQLIQNAQDALSKAQNVVIAGAGPIGVELSGEIAEAAKDSGRDVKITLVSTSHRVLPVLKQSASAMAEQMLEKKGVRIERSCKVTGAVFSPDKKKWTVSLDNGQELAADVYIPTTGTIPNNDFIPEEFLDDMGWVKTDKELRVQSPKANAPLPIFAAGDITANSIRMTFKAVEQATVVANNIKAEILGQGGKKTYDQGNNIMMAVPVGAAGGTGQVAGLVMWSWFVRMVKGKDYLVSKARSFVAAK
ncbi:hypothetical protein BJY00DRAFT_287958 [Aspergillus carlsbadensis]|nr:hypothetical protein BJY00DRAFT_287958 [Aspergillus carlsbadensis]